MHDYKRIGKELGIKVMDFLYRTKTEILVAGAAAVIIGTTVGIYKEHRRTYCTPIAFSEITQIHKDATRDSTAVNHETKVLSGTNDFCMKIFESWNDSRQPWVSDWVEKFGSELENHMKYLSPHPYHIDTLAAMIPEQVALAQNDFEPLANASAQAKTINQIAQQSWTYTATPVYEPHVHVTVDGDGDVQTSIVIEYDHSLHQFEYHPLSGENLHKSLQQIIEDHPHFAQDITVRVPSKTNADNEYVMGKTSSQRRLTPEEEKFYASSFARGSTLMSNLSIIEQNWAALQQAASTWALNKETAHDTLFPSYAFTEAGPLEHQTVQEISDRTNEIANYLDQTLEAMRIPGQAVPELYKKILRFVDNAKKPGAEAAANDILRGTFDLYETCFKNGLEVRRFRPWVIPLYTLGFGATGTLAGFGVDKGVDKIWGKRRKKRKETNRRS